MYNMYPNYEQIVTHEQRLTLRASEAELRRWEAEGAEPADQVDTDAVRVMNIAERAVIEQQQVPRVVGRAALVEFGKIS